SCDIDERAIPVDPDIAAVRGIDPFEAAMIGGEDFELVFTIGADRADDAAAAIRAIGTPVTRIGTVAAEGQRIGPRWLSEWREMGWQHLRNP
ncbi:MAG: hypothetical protein M3301_01425, partial [Chloroflexota bacterium]|nr:hypothetical protein [Chloroflexota bacterium]